MQSQHAIQRRCQRAPFIHKRSLFPITIFPLQPSFGAIADRPGSGDGGGWRHQRAGQAVPAKHPGSRGKCQSRHGGCGQGEYFLRNIEDIDAVNEVYAGFFPGGIPARRVVGTSALPMEALIQIDAVVSNAEGTPPLA